MVAKYSRGMLAAAMRYHCDVLVLNPISDPRDLTDLASVIGVSVCSAVPAVGDLRSAVLGPRIYVRKRELEREGSLRIESNIIVLYTCSNMHGEIKVY